MIGPDSSGNFAKLSDVEDYSNSCFKKSCTCTPHDDFFITANERIDDALEDLVDATLVQESVENNTGRLTKEQRQ